MIWQSTIQHLLVHQGLDQALEDERPTSINETEWTKIQKRVVSVIWLAVALEIKQNMWKEITQKALWEKLENIYTSKLLTNRLCLKMELYKLKMEMLGDLHDHINKFNQLVSVEAKLHGESKVIQRCFDDNNDDDKGDAKKLKDQSKNNSSESRTVQEFKIRIKKNSRLKKKV